MSYNPDGVDADQNLLDCLLRQSSDDTAQPPPAGGCALMQGQAFSVSICPDAEARGPSVCVRP